MNRNIRIVLVFAFLWWAKSAGADQWVIAPSGYYVLSLDAGGIPVVTKANNITGHCILGTPDRPDDPTDPPTDDKWGLVAFSEREARKVGDAETAAKISVVYREIGKRVKDGTIPEAAIKPALELAYRAAVGAKPGAWSGWKIATDAQFNGLGLGSVAEAGQALIDIGLGAQNASTARALGDGTLLNFLKFFLENILPLILDLIENLPAINEALTP